jgi:hypothetical protein
MEVKVQKYSNDLDETSEPIFDEYCNIFVSKGEIHYEPINNKIVMQKRV